MIAPVLLNKAHRAARPWLPELAPVGTVWLGPSGEAVRVTRDGVEPVLPGGHPRPGIAADPGIVAARRQEGASRWA